MPGMICAVVTCQNKGWHIFPTDEELKRQWVKATRIDLHRKIGRNLRKCSRLCSEHFIPSDFENHGKQRRLKKTAVPSIFPWNTRRSTSFINEQSHPPSEENFEIIFDPDKAVKNYSTSEPPVLFVEEYPALIDEKPETDVDPLQYSDEQHDQYCETHEEFAQTGVPDASAYEDIRTSIENTSIITVNTHTDKKQVDRSMQTDVKKSRKKPFSVYNYKHSDKAIHFYTGLETFNKLSYVFLSLGDCSNLKYFYESPPKDINTFEYFFITLLILRRHKEFEEIGMLYLISIKQVMNIFITWIRFMALQWRYLDLWIDRHKIKAYMPLDFYDKYPMTRVILDATECPIKKPGLQLTQQITFSNYKNRNTVKFLIGIAPSGLITYVSPCYGGSATDRQIIERSSILSRFNYSDEIMVDKGLNVQDIFMPHGVKVNIPTFFKKGNQISPETLIRDRKIASKRVHVERIIGMLKTFKILRQPMNQTETILSSDIVFICAMLVNFRSNIISKNA